MDVSEGVKLDWVVETLALLGDSKNFEGRGFSLGEKSTSKCIDDDWELETQIAQETISTLKLSKLQVSKISANHDALCTLCDQFSNGSKMVTCDGCHSPFHVGCVDMEFTGNKYFCSNDCKKETLNAGKTHKRKRSSDFGIGDRVIIESYKGKVEQSLEDDMYTIKLEDNTTRTVHKDGIQLDDQDYCPNDSDKKSPKSRRSTQKKPRWTEEEDLKLIELKSKYGDISWSKIAQSMPDRTSSQCYQRWHRVLNPSIQKGPWAKEETVILLNAVQNREADKISWSQVAKLIKGRTDIQCRYQYLKLVRNGKVQKLQKSLIGTNDISSGEDSGSIPSSPLMDNHVKRRNPSRGSSHRRSSSSEDLASLETDMIVDFKITTTNETDEMERDH